MNSKIHALITSVISRNNDDRALLLSFLGSFLIKIGNMLLAIITIIVLARFLGSENFGLYSLFLSIVTIVAIPAQTGLPNLVIRETARANAVRNGDLVVGVWKWATKFAILVSLLIVFVSIVAINIYYWGGRDLDLDGFYWALALIPIIAVGNIRSAALRGLRYVVSGQLTEFIIRPALLILLIVSYGDLFNTGYVSASTAMIMTVMSALVSFVIGAVLLYLFTPTYVKESFVSRQEGRRWVSSLLPLSLVDSVSIANQNIGIVAIGYFLTPEEAGLFRIALQGSLIVSIGFLVANAVMSPYIAHMHAKDDLGRLQHIITASSRVIFLIAFSIFVTYTIFGEEILSIFFGASYERAYAALCILTVGQLVNSFTGVVGSVLMMTGHEKDVARSLGVGLACTVILTLILTPGLGIEGAALASAMSLALWNALMVLQVRQRTGLKVTPIGF